MEAEVEAKRKMSARRRTRGRLARLGDDGLKQCEQLFRAARENVVEASKNYYADTGLMALLCRHDRALFVANMNTPESVSITH